MLEVEPTDKRGLAVSATFGRNGNEAVAGTASEAFARWLRHRHGHVEVPCRRGPFRRAIWRRGVWQSLARVGVVTR